MAQELTFNITEDTRRLKRPTSVKDFQLSFGHADQGPTDVVIGDDGNIVQGRYGDSARQVFVNVVQGKNNEPVDITGYLPEFNGCIPDAEHIVIDNWDGVLVDPRHGRFRFDFPIQAFTVAGSYKQAYFRLVQNGTGKTLATLEFDMQVLEDFVYSNIVPQDYVTPYLDMINKLKDAYTNFVSKTQDSFDQAKKRLDDIMSTVEDKADTVEQRLKIDEQALAELSKKIDEKGLFTQAEADAFKQEIQEQLDKALTKVDEKLASIFGKGQNPVALSVYWTSWDNDKRQYTQFSVDQMKTSIDGAANYVQGIVVPLRLENDGNQFHVLGNLADIKQGIDYATSKGLKLMGIKIHCVATLEQINNYGMDNFFNDYANSVSAACTSLSLTADTKLTILNERWDLVNEKTYADKVVKLINDLKTATKLSVGISFVQQYLGDAQSSVYSACDFIGLNAYPTVTDLKRSVPFALIASAWQQVAPIIQSLIALYHKPIYLSETGIEDNYEALEDPSNWNVGSQYNSQGEVQYMYFKGLFASGILDYTSAVWIWFDVTSTKAQALIRQYANGVIN